MAETWTAYRLLKRKSTRPAEDLTLIQYMEEVSASFENSVKEIEDRDFKDGHTNTLYVSDQCISVTWFSQIESYYVIYIHVFLAVRAFQNQW